MRKEGEERKYPLWWMFTGRAKPCVGIWTGRWKVSLTRRSEENRDNYALVCSPWYFLFSLNRSKSCRVSRPALTGRPGQARPRSSCGRQERTRLRRRPAATALVYVSPCSSTSSSSASGGATYAGVRWLPAAAPSVSTWHFIKVAGTKHSFCRNERHQKSLTFSEADGL